MHQSDLAPGPEGEPPERRLPSSSLLAVFFLSFPVSFVLGALVRGLVPWSVDTPREKLLLQVLAQLLQAAVALALLSKELKVHGCMWRSVGLDPRRLGHQLAQAVRGWMLLIPVLLVTLQVTELLGRQLGVNPERAELARAVLAARTDPVAAALLLALAVAGAPLLEELLFRGLLFGGLRGRFSFWPAALLSSALFALLHGLSSLPLTQFVLGVFFCHLYESTGSLFASVFAHALNNGAAYWLSLAFPPRSLPRTAAALSPPSAPC